MSESIELQRQIARAAGFTPSEARELLEDPTAQIFLSHLVKQLEVYLTARKRRALIKKMFAQGRTQREIADALGISQPRVSELLRV